MQQVMLERALRALDFVAQGSDALNFTDWATDPEEGPQDRLELEETARLLKRILGKLDEKDRQPLALRYGLAGQLPMTYRQLGRVLGCTREWARKRVCVALRRLTLELHYSGMWG